MYNAFCLKLDPSEPFIDGKGNLVFDGINRDIKLYYTENLELLKAFLNNIAKNQKFVKWKFWITDNNDKTTFELITEPIKIRK